MTGQDRTYGMMMPAGRSLRRAAFAVLLCLAFLAPQGVSAAVVNIDTKTTETLTAGLTAQLAAEKMNSEEIKNMLKRYSESSVALTGIWASKQLQVRAQRKGEKFYYDRIRFRLEKQILPKIFVLGALFIEHPDQVLYWGPYLLKLVEDTAQLAMIFEYVVTNCEVSFADLPWLFINDDIRQYLDIAQTVGNLDWKTMLSKMGDFPSLGGDSLKIDVLLPDMKSIVKSAGTDINTAINNINNIIGEGGDIATAVGGSSGVLGKALHTKVTEWKHLADSFARFYGDMEDAYQYVRDFKDRISQQTAMATSIVDRIKSQYNAVAGDFTPEHLLRTANLFTINGYNIDEYIMRYLDNLTGKYYRKHFWIEKENYRENQVTWKNPKEHPLDGTGTNAGRDYYVIEGNPSSPRFECNDVQTVIQIAARNGWFPTNINYGTTGLNCDFSVYINSADKDAKDYADRMSGYPSMPGLVRIEYSQKKTEVQVNKITSFPPYDKDIYITFMTYGATATVKENGGSEIVYEEYYDSFTGGTNGEEAFRQKMLAKLDIYNGNDKGDTYVLREGEAVYYDEADAERMNGVGEVSYKLRCDNGGNLYDKNYTFKVDEYHEPFNDTSKRIVTSGTSVYSNIATRDSLTTFLQQKKDSVALLKAEISNLQVREMEIENDIRNMNGIASELYEQLEAVRRDIQRKNHLVSTLEGQIPELENAITAYDEDHEDSEGAGTERIPHWEDELVKLYAVRWLGEGYWEGNTYKRRCNVSVAGAHNECFFVVECTKQCGESWCLGIRYHRSQINFKMYLTYQTSTEEVIETKTLDMRKSEQERSDEANERRRQLQEQYPDCSVSMDFHKVDTIGDDPDTKNIHLLWAGDRLEVARLVERQLHRIYCDMVITERHLRSCRRLDQMLKADLRGAVRRGQEARKHHYFIRRWQDLYGFARDTSGLQAYIVNERKREREVWDSIMKHIADSVQ